MTTRSIAVTGASGFVGRHLVGHLKSAGERVMALSRTGPAPGHADISWRTMPDLASGEIDPGLLEGQDALVHCAARVHVMDDRASDPRSEHRAINRDGTLALARAASEAGVRRFVFVSSIKVNGERTVSGRPFHPDDRPAPVDPYGISKAEAEQGLEEIARRTGMEIGIVRPVLVYGAGVGANFRAIARLAATGLPLPLASVCNRRSLVYVGNLVDLLHGIATGRVGGRQVYLASDGRTVSTAELVRMLAEAQNAKARLFPAPPGMLGAAASLLGKGDAAQRLLGNLEVDHEHLEAAGWTAPFRLEEGISRTFASEDGRP